MIPYSFNYVENFVKNTEGWSQIGLALVRTAPYFRTSRYDIF